MNPDTITIVSGLPRSGTSMMMRILQAGGMPVLVDNIRKADVDNPKGYYEFERVKQIETDQAWLKDAKGKVVKMILSLLKHLPDTYAYKVIFMQRDMDEILASQAKMLIRRGEDPDKVSAEEMADLYAKFLNWFESWVKKQAHIDILYVDYNETLQNPQPTVNAVNAFLGGGLDTQAMVQVVDPTLHRNRS